MRHILGWHNLLLQFINTLKHLLILPQRTKIISTCWLLFPVPSFLKRVVSMNFPISNKKLTISYILAFFFFALNSHFPSETFLFLLFFYSISTLFVINDAIFLEIVLYRSISLWWYSAFLFSYYFISISIAILS